jgi:AraC-like DNA-binding protein
MLAARHHITSRHVRGLFELEGTNLSTYVVEVRLCRAEQLLTYPRRRHRPISSIAYEVGFYDLSYFNETFRRRFGMSPTDIRTIQ